MSIINFVCGGKIGDFIHTLYAVKNICQQRNAKANIYLSGHGDIWTFGIEKAYEDLLPLMSIQSYVNKFEILPDNFQDEFINLNDWRNEVATTHAETGKYNKCWSELLSQYYGFEIPKEYKWLDAPKVNNVMSGQMIINRSKHHHNFVANVWSDIVPSLNGLKFFATTDYKEWEQFEFKQVGFPYILDSLLEWVSAINSGSYYVGNQSAGFAIASALDVPRLCELDSDPAPFYIGEEKYSSNISWILNNEVKFINNGRNNNNNV